MARDIWLSLVQSSCQDPAGLREVLPRDPCRGGGEGKCHGEKKVRGAMGGREPRVWGERLWEGDTFLQHHVSGLNAQPSWWFLSCRQPLGWKMLPKKGTSRRVSGSSTDTEPGLFRYAPLLLPPHRLLQ